VVISKRSAEYEVVGIEEPIFGTSACQDMSLGLKRVESSELALVEWEVGSACD
jgi:hypothetical protein